jgi:hypothetical protein
MATIYATSGDTNRVITVTLKDDDVARDLTSAGGIECHVRNSNDGTVTNITGLTGTAGGVVETTIATLTTGRYTIEFEVTEGAQTTTYPAVSNDRPQLFVRDEAA